MDTARPYLSERSEKYSRQRVKSISIPILDSNSMLFNISTD